jgi:hypothetical protein
LDVAVDALCSVSDAVFVEGGGGVDGSSSWSVSITFVASGHAGAACTALARGVHINVKIKLA